MNKILIVAATYPEIKFLEKFGLMPNSEDAFCYQFKNDKTEFNVLVTGVGVVATTFHITRILLANQYELVINTGIAGVFDKSIALGTIVNVVNDCFADVGAEDGDDFISVFDLGIANGNELPFDKGILKNRSMIPFICIQKLPGLNGITVNKTHGNDVSIEKLLSRQLTKNYKPVTESMEGAAIAYVCSMLNVPYVQVRSISNYIERRNRSAWKVQEALSSLEGFFNKLLLEISN